MDLRMIGIWEVSGSVPLGVEGSFIKEAFIPMIIRRVQSNQEPLMAGLLTFQHLSITSKSSSKHLLLSTPNMSKIKRHSFHLIIKYLYFLHHSIIFNYHFNIYKFCFFKVPNKRSSVSQKEATGNRLRHLTSTKLEKKNITKIMKIKELIRN